MTKSVDYMQKMGLPKLQFHYNQMDIISKESFLA